MNYTTLKQSDIAISKLALGCFAFAGGQTWGVQDETDSIATLETAIEQGITFFDTAEGYGEGYSEELLGRVFAGRREQVVIATKASPEHLSAKSLEQACMASLKRLRSDYIDLYQIHWPNHDLPLAETIGMLQELKHKGMVRAIGVSNFGLGDLQDFLQHAKPVSNQLPYNLLWRAIEIDIIPLCLEHDIGILPYSPLMQGLLTGKFASAAEVPPGRARTRHYAGSREQARHGEGGQEEASFATLAALRGVADRLKEPLSHVALAWLMQQPVVNAVLVGARTAEQLEQNLKAADLRLTKETMLELDKLSQPLKETFGSNPDMWNNAANSRYR